MAEKEPFNQQRYNREYNRRTYTRVSVMLNKRTDADIVEHLHGVPFKSRYIKQLIRADMRREPGNPEEDGN